MRRDISGGQAFAVEQSAATYSNYT